MNIPTQHLASLLLAIMTLLSGMNAQAQVSNEQAQSLMQKSGVWDVFPAFSSQMRSGFSQASRGAAGTPGAIAPEQMARIQQAIEQAYETEQLRGAATRQYAQILTPETWTQLVAWYDTEFGKKIVAWEVAASKAADDPSPLITQGQQLYSQAPSERQLALRQITHISEAAQAGADLIINTTLGIMRGFAISNPQLAAPLLKDKEQELRANRSELIRSYQPVAQGFISYTYRQASTEELQQYASFLSSPVGKSFNNNTNQIIDKVLREAAQDMGVEMTKTRPSSAT
jgi:hypothetical protein